MGVARRTILPASFALLAWLAPALGVGPSPPAETRRSAAAASAPQPAEAAEAGERPAAEPAVPHRVGRFGATLAERSPLSDLEELARRFTVTAAQIEAADAERGSYDLAQESFEVYVPPGYRPETAAALLVWVSPTPRGGPWAAGLEEALAARGVIWVGANRSGNARSKWVRMGLALDAAEAFTRLYRVDPERVYVGGYSGGGRTASALALLFPERFRGALCVMGVDSYRPVPVPDRPGAHWPPTFPTPPREALRRVRAEGRFVLFTGERDFNRAQTQAVFAGLQLDGFAHVTYLERPGAAHADAIDGEWLGRALDALDPPPASPAS